MHKKIVKNVENVLEMKSFLCIMNDFSEKQVISAVHAFIMIDARGNEAP